jgi:predicted phosphate transport protein (TIGR00153 family)
MDQERRRPRSDAISTSEIALASIHHPAEMSMFSFLFKKEQQLENLIGQYLENLTRTQEHFVQAMDTCLEMGLCEQFGFLIDQTHKFESKADEIKEEVNVLMYSRALIPEFREDIMNLLEQVDCIPRIFELILHLIRSQKLKLPDFIKPDVKDLIRISVESCELMIKQIDLMLKNRQGIRALLGTIDSNESHCDHIERSLMSKVFDSDLDKVDKLQLKELIIALGEISDQADRVSKRVNIITLKRRV